MAKRAKYMTNLKNLEIFTLVMNGYNFAEVGRMVGLSREYIRVKMLMYNLTGANVRRARWDLLGGNY